MVDGGAFWAMSQVTTSGRWCLVRVSLDMASDGVWALGGGGPTPSPCDGVVERDEAQRDWQRWRATGLVPLGLGPPHPIAVPTGDGVL